MTQATTSNKDAIIDLLEDLIDQVDRAHNVTAEMQVGGTVGAAEILATLQIRFTEKK